jgi:hypothetical protein
VIVQARSLSLQVLLTLSNWICVRGRFHPSIDFGLDQRGIVEQADDFVPNKFIKIILPDWAILTQSSLQAAPGI